MNDASATLQRQTDVMDPARANALMAALGGTTSLQAGDPVPPFFHQLYFWTALPPDKLGRDGHPARGQGAIPDMGLPRRMWAGGRVSFEKPLRLGQIATCETTCLSATHKNGRSGPLALVTLGLVYSQNGQTCIREERDLIYREDPQETINPPNYQTTQQRSEHQRPLQFSSTLLFRYSALTFNGHRIHYDLDYATGVEGYSGLVVHGPLLAQHLILLATETLGPLRAFSFRATAPLMHHEAAQACIAGTDLWICGPGGRLCIQAQAVPAET